MNTQPTCEQRINSHLADRLNDLRIMFYGPTIDDIKLIDDGTLDTVIQVLDREFRYSEQPMKDKTWAHMSIYRNDDGTLDLNEFFNDERDSIAESLGYDFYEYGLCFDYVAEDTFSDQEQAYFRYQLSYGGPSDEFRFYVNPDLSCYLVEYVLLDWFDGATLELTGDDKSLLINIYNDFRDCGTVEHLLSEV